MKKHLYFFLVFFIALVSGTVSSIYMVYHFGNTAVNESIKIYALNNNWDSEFKGSIGHRISTALKENDIESLKRLACTLLDLSIKYTDPDYYKENPARKNDIVSQIKKYKNELAELRQEGYCDKIFQRQL